VLVQPAGNRRELQVPDRAYGRPLATASRKRMRTLPLEYDLGSINPNGETRFFHAFRIPYAFLPATRSAPKPCHLGARDGTKGPVTSVLGRRHRVRPASAAVQPGNPRFSGCCGRPNVRRLSFAVLGEHSKQLGGPSAHRDARSGSARAGSGKALRPGSCGRHEVQVSAAPQDGRLSPASRAHPCRLAPDCRPRTPSSIPSSTTRGTSGPTTNEWLARAAPNASIPLRAPMVEIYMFILGSLPGRRHKRFDGKSVADANLRSLADGLATTSKIPGFSNANAS